MNLIKENQEIKKLLVEQNKQTSEQNKKVLEQNEKVSEQNKKVLEQNEKVLEQNEKNNVLINKLVEKDLITNNITNNNTINNNQKFNLNIFLNETCKDAMNMKEFLDNIKITFEELLVIGNTGFVNGVSDIFIKRLQDLEVTKRPIHCTDVKRETIYLKEEDKWNKDDNENTKLKDAIEKVEYKNVTALHSWCSKNPVITEDDNLLRDNIYLQALLGNNKNRDKVIKNISREVTIDKTQDIIVSN
jgi:hypothetical protein